MLRSTSQNNKVRNESQSHERLVISLGDFSLSYWGGGVGWFWCSNRTRSMFSHMVSSKLAVLFKSMNVRLNLNWASIIIVNLRGAKSVRLSLRHVGSSDARNNVLQYVCHGWPRVAVTTAPSLRSLWMKWDATHTHRSMCLRQVSQRHKEVEQGKTLFEEEGLWGGQWPYPRAQARCWFWGCAKKCNLHGLKNCSLGLLAAVWLWVEISQRVVRFALDRCWLTASPAYWHAYCAPLGFGEKSHPFFGMRWMFWCCVHTRIPWYSALILSKYVFESVCPSGFWYV